MHLWSCWVQKGAPTGPVQRACEVVDVAVTEVVIVVVVVDEVVIVVNGRG